VPRFKIPTVPKNIEKSIIYEVLGSQEVGEVLKNNTILQNTILFYFISKITHVRKFFK